MKKILILLFVIITTLKISFSSEVVVPQMKETVNGFVENKGQILDQSYRTNWDVLYLLKGNGLNVQIRKGGFSYDTYIIEKRPKEFTAPKADYIRSKHLRDSFDYAYNYHRIDVELVNANINPKFEAKNASSDYSNYYNITKAPEGILSVYSFQNIIVKDVYKGIDVEYLVDSNNGFKYNFIIHPGANIDDIKLKYDGAACGLINNQIEIKSDNSLLKEKIPACWFLESPEENIKIEYRNIENGIYGFSCDEKLKKSINTLVIDPALTRIWGTYYGGSGDESYASVTTDLLGNVFLGGITGSTSNIATSGSHKSTLSGGYDHFLVKFNSNGVRQWGTYYGGSGYEYDIAITTDPSGNILLAGTSGSTNNISTTGSHQSAFGGGTYDNYLAKFNTSGVRQWGTYYGGLLNEYYVSVTSDLLGNIYLGGQTNSISGISTSGSYQSTLGGASDNYLVKFNTSGVRQWGTYYGGLNTEDLTALTSDPNGNIILGGRTNSTNSISTTGSHQSNLDGGYDNYIVKFNTSGTPIWATYYGGSSNEDVISLATDTGSNIFLGGITTSVNNISTSGSHQALNAGSFDNFLVKFDASGVRQWGTYIGGTNDETYASVATDTAGNIYLAAETASTNNISTSGAYQSFFGGGLYDHYMAKFNSSGVRQWGSYFGGSGYEYYVSLAYRNGNLFLGGSTSSTSGIATSGSHKSTISGVYDNYLVKFFTCNSATLGSITTITNPVGTICKNVGVDFSISAPVANASGYFWKVPAGWVISGGQGTTSITAIPSVSGTISVKAYNQCGDSTSNANLFINVTITPQPTAITGPSAVCNGVANLYSVTNVAGTIYQWAIPSNWIFVGASNTNSVNITPNIATASGVVNVSAIKDGCISSVSQINVSCSDTPSTPSVIQGNNPACKNTLCNFSVDTLNLATSYIWTFPATGWTVFSGASTRSVNVMPGATSIAGNITVRGSNYCGISAISSNLAALTPVSAPSQPDSISGNAIVCSASSQSYSINNVSGAVYYRWTVPPGWTVTSGQGSASILVTTNTSSGSVSVYAANGGNNACESTPRSLAVSVTTTPATPTQILGPSEVCINGSYSYSTPIIPGASSYSWIVPSGFNITSGVNSNSIIVSTSSSISTVNQLSVRANYGSCSSSYFSYNIMGFLITPIQPDPITGDAILCSNSSKTYFTSPVPNAIEYIWTLPGGWSFSGPGNLNSVSVISGTNTGIISVIARNGACLSQARTFAITAVNPTPATPGTINYSGNICSGKSSNFSIVPIAGASSYNWILPDTWTGSSSTSLISITPGINGDTLKVSAINGSCASAEKKQFIAVKQTPAQPLPITGISQVCINSGYFYNISRQLPATSHIWTVPSGWTISGGGNDTFITATPNFVGLSGNISVQANNSGCLSALSSLAISVNTELPSTPGPINGKNQICNGVESDFSINIVPKALSYLWTVPTGWTISNGQGTLIMTAISNATPGTVKVRAINGACSSNDRQFSVSSILAVPAMPVVSGEVYPCLNQQSLYSVAAVPGAISYNWTSPVGWTISAPTSQATNILIAGNNGIINVSANNGVCNGSESSFEIVSTQLPQMDKIDGEVYVKSYTVRNYTTTYYAGLSYIWSIPSDWSIVSGSGQNSITVLTGTQSGVVSVKGQNKCGAGLPFIKNVYSGVSQGIEDESYISKIKIYPQPADEFFKLSFYSNIDFETAKITIFDMQGKQYFSYPIEGLSANVLNEIVVPCSQLSSGIYLLNIRTEKFNKVFKISVWH